jgi:zinc protease
VDGAGLVYSPAPGVAQVTAEMLDQGSKDRSARQISEDAGRLGATVRSGVYVDRESAVLDGSGLSSHFDDWLAVCAGCVAHPSFSSDEFNSLKQRWQVNRHLRMAEADTIAEETILQLIYGTHPAGLGDPAPAEIAALTPEIAADWHRQRYTPRNTVLSVIGRVRGYDVAARAERLLGSWNAPEPRFSLPPDPQPAAQRHIALIGRRGAPQTRLELGNLLIQRADPAYFAMVVLDQVLGHSGESRLQRVLESSGQALTATSFQETAHYTGYWQITAAVRTELTARALSAILGELRRLCQEPVPPQELEEAKRAVVGRFALTLEHPTTIINYSYQRHRYGFSNDYWESYPARIGAVTAAEVQAVAQKYYDPDRAHIVAVGDDSKIRADLAKLGPIDA